MSEEEKKAELTNQQKLDALKDTAEYAALLNNHGKTYLEAKEGELGRKYTGQAWNLLDKKYMEAMGLEERPDGKTTDIIINTALENVKLKEKLASLSSEENNNKGNEDLKGLHANQIAAMQKQLEEANRKSESLVNDLLHKETSNAIALGLQNATFDPKYSESVLGDLIKIRKDRLLDNRKVIDGKDVFYKSDGTIYEHANGLPMSAKEVANEAFKDLFQVKTKGGNADNENGNATTIKGDIAVIPNANNLKSYAEFTTEFNKVVRAKGWAAHDTKTTELKRATIKHYKLEGLPLE